MLAEGDVDPAAGSRDEPTRLHVEAPIEDLRNKYTKTLFFESNNWVQALPPTFADFCRLHFFGSRGDPKTRQKIIEKTKGTIGGSKNEKKGLEP